MISSCKVKVVFIGGIAILSDLVWDLFMGLPLGTSSDFVVVTHTQETLKSTLATSVSAAHKEVLLYEFV